VMGPWPHLAFQGARRPAERVSWDDICKKTDEGEICFLDRLNQMADGKFIYRLPSESEREYAARGGHLGRKTEEGEMGDFRFAGSNHLKEVGWFKENSGAQTHEVGLKMPNALGIFDMSGNVWEWCADEYSGSYGVDGVFPEKIDRTGRAFELKKDAILRVVRGGSWGGNGYCSVSRRRSDHRPGRYGSNGFRLFRY